MAQRGSNKDSGKGNRPSLGVLFWIACILLILVIFLFNRQNIQAVLQNTQFLEVISDNLGGDEPLDRAPDAEDSEPQVSEPGDTESQDGDPSVEPASPVQTVQDTETPQVIDQDTTTDEEQSPPDEPGSEPTTTNQTVSAEPDARTRTYQLYFVSLTDTGQVQLQARPRGIRFVDSPLTATLQALLSGPASSELNEGLLSVVPDGSQLLSAAIRDGVAYLSFNEAFRFNPLGYEGQKAQLQQVVFTATEFPSVEQVQILIEGRTVNYLGGDGFFVGAPLQRGSF